MFSSYLLRIMRIKRQITTIGNNLKSTIMKNPDDRYDRHRSKYMALVFPTRLFFLKKTGLSNNFVYL